MINIHHKKIILLLITATLIIVGVFLAWHLSISKINVSEINNSVDEPVATEDSSVVQARIEQSIQEGEIRDKAQEAVSSGDLETSRAVYEQAINNTESVEQKIRLQLDESAVLFAADLHQQAIEVALKADAYSDDKFLLADWLSRVYEYLGDNQKAAEYYRLAGEWANSPHNKSAKTSAQFEADAVRVEGL